MCSICGMIDRCGHADKELVAKMGLTMKNRGPDASEGFSDSFVALHHNRLAVIDPAKRRAADVCDIRRQGIYHCL